MIVAIQNRNPKSNNFAAGAGPGRQSDQMKMGNRQGATGNSGKVACLLCALGALLFTLCLPAQAQQPKKLPRIGYLSGVDRAGDALRSEAFRRALRERGYIEGQNLVVEYRYAKGRGSRELELAAELVRLNMDVIVVAGGDTWIEAAKRATSTIPIVMTGPGSDPVEAGFVKSLARPGGNVTGVTNLSRELGGKRLELLKEVVSRCERVAVLYDPVVPGTAREVKEDLPVAARALRLSIQQWQVRNKDEFEKVFVAMAKDRPDGLYVPGGGSLVRDNERRIIDFALKNRIASLFAVGSRRDGGGLMSYSVDVGYGYQRVAHYVEKILKGAKPADLPIEQPTKFEFAINLKTANHIGLTIPPHVLARADRVIR
jgi:putative ABC transport system substrate-binding protein